MTQQFLRLFPDDRGIENYFDIQRFINGRE